MTNNDLEKCRGDVLFKLWCTSVKIFKKCVLRQKDALLKYCYHFFLPLETLPNYDFLCIFQSKDKEIISFYQKFSVQLHQFVFTCWRHNGACEKNLFQWHFEENNVLSSTPVISIYTLWLLDIDLSGITDLLFFIWKL